MMAGLPPWRLYVSGVFNVIITHFPLENHDAIKKKDKPCLVTDTLRSFYEIALRSMAWDLTDNHYSDVKMSTMASQITGVSIVYLTISSGADQRKHQSFASLAFVRGIHRWPVNSHHKGLVTQKMFPFDDVIMEATLDQLMTWCRQVTKPFIWNNVDPNLYRHVTSLGQNAFNRYAQIIVCYS